MTSDIHKTPGLIDQFTAAAGHAGATVERIRRSADILNEALQKSIGGADSVVMAEPDDLPLAFFDSFHGAIKAIRYPSEVQMAAAQIGITDAYAGVARTGSVVIPITKKSGGAVSLFTRTHIAILDAKNIVPRPRDVFSANYLEGKGLSHNFVFVTGPSATADMGSLVRGVHGPAKLHIIILEL